jgi:hypothetical protein
MLAEHWGGPSRDHNNIKTNTMEAAMSSNLITFTDVCSTHIESSKNLVFLGVGYWLKRDGLCKGLCPYLCDLASEDNLFLYSTLQLVTKSSRVITIFNHFERQEDLAGIKS